MKWIRTFGVSYGERARLGRGETRLAAHFEARNEITVL
jgi:hypothetical protein